MFCGFHGEKYLQHLAITWDFPWTFSLGELLVGTLVFGLLVYVPVTVHPPPPTHTLGDRYTPEEPRVKNSRTAHYIQEWSIKIIFTYSFSTATSRCRTNNGGCEQLCLPKSGGGRRCACATGFTLGDDNKSCTRMYTVFYTRPCSIHCKITGRL
jgi:hypothetical protein